MVDNREKLTNYDPSCRRGEQMREVRPIDANGIICPYCGNKMEPSVECSICRFPADHPDYWPCAPEYNYRACFVCHACSQRTSNTFHSPVEHAATEEEALAKAVTTASSYVPVRLGEWVERKEIFDGEQEPVDAIGCSQCGKSQRVFRRTPY